MKTASRQEREATCREACASPGCSAIMHAEQVSHPGVESRAILKSTSHRCYLFEVAFPWELSKDTIHSPLGCLQGGEGYLRVAVWGLRVEGCWLRVEG
jgi:hypothetical protein